MIDQNLVDEAGKKIRNAQRILLASHIRPDGDAIGSLLGMGLSLQAAGKDAQMVLSDGVPSNFRHLPGREQIRFRPEGEFDLTVVLDCSDLERTGEAISGFSPPDVNIDHHITNVNFARINLVDASAVATAEMIHRLLPAWGLPVNEQVAETLLTGLITDTLGFRTSNMTPGALRAAAELMEHGANLPDLYRQALISRQFKAAKFWGAGLSKLERDGDLIWTSLLQDERKAVDYPGRDDADLINILSSIEDAKIAIIFVEQPAGSTKVSWRAQPGYDVSGLALSFGGGGHPAAAGADIPGRIEQVKEKVLQATRKYMQQMNGNERV